MLVQPIEDIITLQNANFPCPSERQSQQDSRKTRTLNPQKQDKTVKYSWAAP